VKLIITYGIHVEGTMKMTIALWPMIFHCSMSMMPTKGKKELLKSGSEMCEMASRDGNQLPLI